MGGTPNSLGKATVQLSQITTYTAVHPSHFSFSPKVISKLEQRVALKKPGETKIYNMVISFKKGEKGFEKEEP